MAPKPVLEKHDYFPPFGGLKAFYEVALHGSAAKAAARLRVTASSVSHQLRSLEADLGVRLIENRKGKLHLTADGAQYFAGIKGPMSQVLRATERVRSSPDRKRVTLTLTPSFAADWLMHRLLELGRTHPELDIDLITTTRVVDLARENVDLAIRRGSAGVGSYFAEPLLRETIVPVAAPGSMDPSVSMRPEDALKNNRLLVNTTVEGEWDMWCATRGITLPEDTQRYNLATYELTVQAARDGLGIALGRKPLVDHLLASGDLVQAFEARDLNDTYYYIVRRDEPMRLDVKRLYMWLMDQVG